jgi:hypothetical protein
VPRYSPVGSSGREGAPQAAETVEGLSTDAGCAGGPARSSDEAPVMGVERRGRVIRGCVCLVNRTVSGRNR